MRSRAEKFCSTFFEDDVVRLFINLPARSGRAARARWVGREKRERRTKRVVRAYPLSRSP